MFSIIKKYKRNLNNICKFREKGVSLISLIVIIIVLLILAGVTIRISSGDSGLIKKTKKGVAMYQNASVNESETLNEYARKLKAFVEVPKAETIEFKADITGWTTKDVTVTATSDDPNYEIELKSEDSDWSVRKDNKITVSRNQQINARLKNLVDKYSEDVSTYNVTNIDKDAPDKTAPALKATTNSITVTFKQKDDGSGIAKREYSIDNGATWKAGDSVFTFSGLTQGKKYEIITRATDRVENQSISDVSYITTETIPAPVVGSNLTFTPSTSSWTNSNVSVAVSTTVKGYTLQTSTDGKTWSTTNPLTYSANGTAYARLWDGNNASAVATTNITNIDKLAPTNTAPTVATTTNKITITNKQVDQDAANGSGKSDLNASKTQYRLVTDTNGTTAVTGKDWQSSNVFSGLTQNTAYYVQTKVTDNAGNTITSAVATAKTTSVPTLTTGANVIFTPSTSSWTNENVNVTVSTTITGFTLQTSTDGKTWGTTNPLTYSGNGTAYARLWDGNNASAVATTNITNIDKLAPTNTAPTVETTTNKITATVKQVDQNAGSGSGKSDLNVSKTQYRLVTDTNGTTAVTGKDWQSSNVFSGLTQNTTYYVQTKVTDNAGNTTTSAVATAKTGEIPGLTTGSNLTFTPTPSAWTNGNVSVAVSTTEKGYTLQTSTDGKTWGTINPLTYSANDTAYARLWDGNNASAVATTNITNIDKLAPTNTAPTVATTTNKITITNKQVDQNAANGSGKSDLNASKTQYRLVTDTNGTTAVTGKDWQSSNVFSGLTQNTTYYVQTKATDNAGNTTTSAVATAKTGEIPGLTTGSNLTFTPTPSGWTNSNVSVAVSTTVTGYTLQTSTDGKTWGTTNPLTYSANGTAYARLWDGNNASAVATTNITNIDKLAPTNTAPTVETTTNKITITNKQVDQNAANGSGKSDLNASKTQYRLVTDTNGTTAVTGKDWQSSNVFSGLTQNTAYYVQTKVTDNAGNTTTSAVATAKTTIVPSGTTSGVITLTPDHNTWTNTDVKVTATTNQTGYTIQMSTDGKTFTDGTSKTLTSNGTVYARLRDSSNNYGASASISISIIDKVAPKVDLVEEPTNYINSQAKIKVTTDVENKYTKGYYAPWSNNGGAVEDVSSTESGPITSSKTWKLTKTGTGNQWNGWQGTYDNIFSANVGDRIMISGYYKTSASAGYKDLSAGNVYKSDWSKRYNTTTEDSKLNIVEDGKWNYFYTIFKANEAFSNATIDAGPNWGYSTKAGTLYINGLNWRIIPSSNTTAKDIHFMKYATGSQNSSYFESGNGTYLDGNEFTITNNGTYTVWAKDIAGNTTIKTINITNFDKESPTTTAPTVTNTTNSITVTNKQTDALSGIASIQYQIKKNSDSSWGTLQSGATFNGLTQNTKYDVRTHAVDKAGNASDSAVTTITTGTIPGLTTGSNLTFTPTPSDWTNGNVSVKVSTTVTGYSLQTSTDGKSWGITNPLTYSANGTAYARLWDGNNASAVATTNITNIDKTEPSFNATVSNVSSSGYDVIITGVSDTQSGVNRIQCPTWTELNGQDDIDYSWSTSDKSKATKQADGSYKFRVNITDHKNENGKYITHVYGYDNVGNNKAIALSATVPAVTITWNANGGTAVNATSGKAGNAIGTLPTTTRTGYTFAGWFTAASGGTQITTTSTYPTSGNVTYYAHWSTNKYYYDVNPNAGIASFDITYGGTTETKLTDFYRQLNYGTQVVIKNVVAKPGYTYTGYSLSGTLSKDNSSTNQNIITRLGAGNGAIALTGVDKTAPTTTAPTATTKTNSITVTNKQTDNGSGIASIQYQIKKNGTSTWGSLQSSATFGGLTQNTKYDVRTHAVDKAGNASDSAVATAKTGTIPTPVRGSNVTFTATPTTKTSGNVTVKVSTTVTGYTLQTSTNGSSWGTTNPLTFTANGTAYARLWDGNNASAVATLNVTNIDKTNYKISYNLNGGSASGNPTSYKVDSSTITINDPTLEGCKFLGWTGSNDLSSGLGNYTSSSPYVASARDHILGNEFNVVAGEKYRVFVRGTRTKGNLDLQGGIWYTSQTSGAGYDGYGGSFTEIETGLFYKEITIPAGKTKGRFYIQLEQATSGGSTSWKLYDMHVIKVENPTIPKGSQGNKSYTANWKLSIDANTPVGTKIGSTTVDGQKLDWYLFDVSDDGKTAYLVSTPTYWVPDTTKEVRGAWAPKLVSAQDDNTGAMRQAIQKLANGNRNYSSRSVTYKPSDNTLNYYKSVNSQWSAKRGNTQFANMYENEQVACYLADADIFAGIKNQVNNADGNLKGKIQTLVGGASAEQWCKAHNKQSAAKYHKITCEYSATRVPGYIYKVNGRRSTVSDDWWTGNKTVVGNDIYGAAYTNGNTSSSNPFYYYSWWWLDSPSSYNSISVGRVGGDHSYFGYGGSDRYSTRVSLFASVAL